MKKITPLAAAVALAIGSLSAAQAQAASSPAQLEKQLQALQQSVAALQAELAQQKQQNAAAADVVTQADAAETYATRDEVQGLQSDLENYKYQVQRERDTQTALSTRGLLISGVIQGKYSATSQQVNNPNAPAATAVRDRTSTFDLGAVQIGFNGSLYKDYDEGRNLDYALRFGTSPQQGTNNSYLNLLDANLVYNALPTVNPEDPRLTVTFGQQLLPYGLEVQSTEELKPTINVAQFSLPTTGIAGSSGLDLSRRQLGLIVRGELWPVFDYGYSYRATTLTYALGIINGNGPNKTDDNNHKDLVGRLAYTLPVDYNSLLRQLTLGASFYEGQQNLYLTDPSTASQVSVGEGRKDRYGLDLSYNHHPIGITYEYNEGFDAKAKGTTAARGEDTTVHSRSHTATLFYNFGEQFVKGYRVQGRFDDWWPKSYQPFYRFDRFNPNVDLAHQRVDIHTAGLNVFFAQTTKFQLNINHNDYESTGKQANDFLAQFQFGF